MVGLFYNCLGLEEIDLSGLMTKKVKIMSRMFNGSNNLKIKFRKRISCNKCKNYVKKIFIGCNNLKDMVITNFDFNNCKNYNDMFSGCDNLELLEAKDNFL